VENQMLRLAISVVQPHAVEEDQFLLSKRDPTRMFLPGLRSGVIAYEPLIAHN
jgi:hypothetical protein